MGEQARALADTMSSAVKMKAQTVGFDEAFTLHHRAVYRAAHSVVRDAALAEDVTQEVFIRLYKNIDSPPSEELLRAWLLRVALNLAKNVIRGNTRAMTREDEYAKQAEADGWFTAEPETDYERKAQIAEARRALDKIKEPMRSCLLLKQQGLSYKEIATALSVNETNVGSLVARGRKEFVRLYGKIGGQK
jgi:RNA polymerase sigma-70 factor (ECF subfamily)